MSDEDEERPTATQIAYNQARQTFRDAGGDCLWAAETDAGLLELWLLPGAGVRLLQVLNGDSGIEIWARLACPAAADPLAALLERALEPD